MLPAPTETQPALLATFLVREALCALDAGQVQEVIRMGAVTPVHHAPEAVLGIVNLRGRIVTILDLGLTLGFAKAVPGPEARVFIIDDRGEFIGLMVDRVSEVIEVEAGVIEPPPANVSQAQGRFFRGVCRSGRNVVALLDVDRVLSESAR